VKLKGILHDTKQPYTLKQMEKLGSKAGVTTMSIKGVLEEMVSDGVIEMDKIGSTNWYWSFPSKEIARLQAKAQNLEENIDGTKRSVADLEEKVQELFKERVASDERTRKLKELAEIKAKISDQETKMKELSQNDPAKKQQLVQELEECKNAANRWTDNTWVMMDYLKKKHGICKKQLYQMFQITDDFDYPEYSPPKPKKKKR